MDATAMWSPTAVLGYRIWTIAGGRFCGHWQIWHSPTKLATCAAEGQLPHTDGRCAEVAFGCGVYAAKAPRPLLAGKDIRRHSSFAVGLVGLEGELGALILGVLAGMREGSRTDRALSTVSIVSTATPEYVSGVVFISVFATATCISKAVC